MYYIIKMELLTVFNSKNNLIKAKLSIKNKVLQLYIVIN